MTEIPPADAPLTGEELAEAERRALLFNIEAARAGLFAAAVDIAEEMKSKGVAQVDVVILTAAAEMSAQLWQQVGWRRGVPMRTCRKNLLTEIGRMWSKHLRLDRANGDDEDAEKVTIQ